MGIRAGQSELKAIAEKRYIRERQDKAVGIQNIDKVRKRRYVAPLNLSQR